MKLKRREMLLFAVPSLLLAGALAAQFRPDAVRRVRERYFPPNHFFIEKIEFPPPTPYEVSQGHDTKVLVVMNYGAPRPTWWDAQNSWMSQYVECGISARAPRRIQNLQLRHARVVVAPR